MQKSWYSINWNRCRLIKVLQFALIITLAFAGTPAFASVPDWLKQVAQAPLPPYPDDTDAVVLLDERLTTVSPTGEVRTTCRKAFKILRPEGRIKGTVYVYFDSQTQLTFLNAKRRIRGQGRRRGRDRGIFGKSLRRHTLQIASNPSVSARERDWLSIRAATETVCAASDLVLPG
jgi:hypothetical protein